jgi:hypothetical protein
MVRPVRDDLPACPRDGHGGEGWYVVRDGQSSAVSTRPKQRYKCISPAGARHAFIPPLPRDRTETVEACYACGNTVGTHQGPLTLPHSRYQLIEVVNALIDVASGITYTEAARRVRSHYLGDRASYREEGGESGSTIANWVDLYAPTLLAAHLPQEWPAGVSFDSTEFMYTNAWTKGRSQLFTVLAATGYEEGKRGKLWALRAYPTDKTASWKDLMGSIPGRPDWVVFDGDKSIGSAVRTTWARRAKPTALHWSEPHLFKNALAALKKDGVGEFEGMFPTLLTTAFKTEAGWDAFTRAVQDAGLANTGRWVAVRDNDVRTQVVRRDTVGKYSTGGVETPLNAVKAELARRSWTFRNLARMNLLLGLLQLRLTRADNPNDWVQTLADALETNGGHSTYSYNREPKDDNGRYEATLRFHKPKVGPKVGSQSGAGRAV